MKDKVGIQIEKIGPLTGWRYLKGENKKFRISISSLETHLNNQQYIGGDKPSALDRTSYAALKHSKVDVVQYPNVYAWLDIMALFSEEV